MPLQEQIQSLLAERAGHWGVYARNLGTGETVAVDAETPMYTASTAKTFILVHYARLVERGECDPNRRVELTVDDIAMGSGVMRFLAPGLQPTLQDLAWMMIIVSDNLATDVLLREVGGAAVVNATMASLGLSTARLGDRFKRGPGSEEPFGTSSARDLAEVYTHLDERCRTILFRQQFIEGLPRTLPHTPYATDMGFDMPVRVFNKTGWDLGFYIDSGRFETDDAAWVAAVMASELADLTGPDGVGPATAGAIGQMLHDAWGSP